MSVVLATATFAPSPKEDEVKVWDTGMAVLIFPSESREAEDE